MKKLYFQITCIIALYVNPMQAQNFRLSRLEPSGGLKSLQQQLSAWADTANVAQSRYYKYIKRWENELSIHSSGDGEPGDARELIRYKQQRQAQKSSSSFNALWYPVGPNALPENGTGYMENGIGRINCMAFHPSDPSTMFVGVAQGGLWKTSDNGQSWMPLTDDLPITRVSDICIDPQNPDVMYISLCDFEYVGISLELNGRKRYPHYGLGVYKSTDGGNSWVQTSLNYDLTDGDASLIRKILIHPENSNTLMACGTSGMFRSEDAGNTWNAVLDTLFWDMIQDPSDPDVLYAASGWLVSTNEGYASIFKSLDFGQTWTELNAGIPHQGAVQRIKLAVSESNPNFVYAITVDIQSGLYGMYRSTDAGASWTGLLPFLNILSGGDGFDAGGQGTYDLVLHVDRFDPWKVYAGGVNLWMSNDGAENFDPVNHWTLYYGPTIHGDMHYMTQHPLTNDYFICSDGGVYKTDYIQSETWENVQSGSIWPTVWENLSDGMQISSYYRLASSKNNDGRLLAGAQDNATMYFNGQYWRTIFGGDGMDTYMSQTNDQLLIGAAQYGVIYQTEDEAIDLFNFHIADDVGETAEWTAPISGCPTGSGTVYVGFENVWRSIDEGQTWELPGYLDANFQPLTALEVARTNCDKLFAASKIDYVLGFPARLFLSEDAGQTWEERSAGLPDSLYFTSIAISPLDDNYLVVSMAGFSSGEKVYRSTNNGITWENISFNLGNFPVNMLKFLPSSNHLLAATDAGLFLLQTGQTTWIDESDGLPNVIVSDIEINQAANKVYLSTFGRGIWASDLNIILAQTSVNPCLNDIRFSSLSNQSWEIEVLNAACKQSLKQLDVLDIMGRIVYTSQLNPGATQFQLPGLAAGVYFARLSGDGSMAVQKFVKSN